YESPRVPRAHHLIGPIILFPPFDLRRCERGGPAVAAHTAVRKVSSTPDSRPMRFEWPPGMVPARRGRGFVRARTGNAACDATKGRRSYAVSTHGRSGHEGYQEAREVAGE